MSSLAAVFDEAGIENPHALIRRLEKVLIGGPSSRLARHVTASFAGLNVLKPFSFAREQPVHSNSACVFIDGSFFNDLPLSEIVDIILSKEPNALRALNGQFNSLSWEQDRNEVTILTDRLGTRPLYYGYHRGRHVVCSEIKGVHATLGRTVELSEIGILELFAFAHNVADRTVFDGITVLPPGSIITLSSNGLSLRSYDEVHYTHANHSLSISEWSEQISHSMKNVMPRYLQGDARKGIFLSGGLDSRAVAGAIEHAAAHIPSYTFGNKESRDVRYAKKMARNLGFPHKSFQYEKNFLSSSLMDVALRTECSAPFYHATSILFHEQIAKETDSIIVGFCGDVLSGGHLNRGIIGSSGGSDISRKIFNRALCTSLSDLSTLFQRSFFDKFWPQTIEAFFSSVQDINEPTPTDIADVWDIRHRQRRFTFSAPKVDRQRFEVIAPLLDRDFVDLMTSMPVKARWKQLAYRNAIVDGFPKIRNVAWTKTGRVIPKGRGRFWLDEGQRIGGRLRRVILSKLLPSSVNSPDSYRDIARYFRDDECLIPVFLAECLSNDTLPTDVFDVDGIRRVAARHIAGEDLSHLVGTVLTISAYLSQTNSS